MKKISLFLLFCGLCNFAQSQIKATTENGDEVILYENGTWTYKNKGNENAATAGSYTRTGNLSMLLKSQRLNVGLWMDPAAWTYSAETDGGASEYSFKHNSVDLYCKMIVEETAMPLEALKAIAIENARKAAPDISVVREEYRTVNGLRVLYMQMAGTAQGGLRFMYSGYYYSNERGSVQLITYSSQNIIERYTSVIENFLNGFIQL